MRGSRSTIAWKVSLLTAPLLAASPGLTQPAPNTGTVAIPPGWPASAPKPIKRFPPAYPTNPANDYPLSQIAGPPYSGDVTICFTITSDGSVSDARVKHANFPPTSRDLEVAAQERQTYRAMEQAVLNAIRKWKFEPARRNGKPVDVPACQTIRFQPRY
jgi:outer membrane biosynthesis protein TonB